MQSKSPIKSINMTLLCLTACICQNLYAEAGSTEPVLLPTLKIQATRTDTDWLATPASVYRIEQKNIKVDSNLNRKSELNTLDKI